MSDKFRRFRVTRKERESAIITSLYFTPCDDEPAWPAQPGQYLTLRIPTENGTAPKTYSISNNVAVGNELRITVKRESAPVSVPDAPPGSGSTWIHDVAVVGTELEIAAPRGSFVLDQDSQRPVVMLSGGVGQTPLLSMLHSLVTSDRTVCYIHACLSSSVHAMHQEVESLVKNVESRITYRVCYETTEHNDHSDKRFQNSYFHGDRAIDKSLLQSLLPIDDYDCYLCGPTPFMVAMYNLLIELGVPENRIAYEFFGKALSLPALAAKEKKTNTAISNTRLPAKSVALTNAPAALVSLAHLINPDARAVADDTIVSIESTVVQIPKQQNVSNEGNKVEVESENDVEFALSGVKASWTETSSSILALAEQAGLSPEFSCRSGICNTCLCNIREGRVEYFEEPLERPENGKVLICCARPIGHVVLEL